MEQLAGQKCLFCNERIDGDFDSAYCLACGYPRHNSCVVPEYRREGDRAMFCKECGSTAKTRHEAAIQPQFARNIDTTSPLACPMCGILNPPGTVDC
jgi:hypothetical protein